MFSVVHDLLRVLLDIRQNSSKYWKFGALVNYSFWDVNNWRCSHLNNTTGFYIYRWLVGKVCMGALFPLSASRFLFIWSISVLGTFHAFCTVSERYKQKPLVISLGTLCLFRRPWQSMRTPHCPSYPVSSWSYNIQHLGMNATVELLYQNTRGPYLLDSWVFGCWCLSFRFQPFRTLRKPLLLGQPLILMKSDFRKSRVRGPLFFPC